MIGEETETKDCVWVEVRNFKYVIPPLKTQRNGALAFAKSLLNYQDWFEELWNRRRAITDKPTLLIWGMKGPVIKSHYLDKF